MLTEKNKVEKSLLNLQINWTSFLCYMTNIISKGKLLALI